MKVRASNPRGLAVCELDSLRAIDVHQGGVTLIDREDVCFYLSHSDLARIIAVIGKDCPILSEKEKKSFKIVAAWLDEQ